jgi:hypothetical protein
VDLVDANCNFRVGDPERPTMYKSGVNGSESDWRFQGGDRFLVDWPGVGRVQSSLVENQSCAFSPILYLDAKPYRVTLAADSKTLSLDPWTEPLAELALQPHGEQVSSVELAWEQAPGDWVLLKPAVENGNAKVPPGNYRLYAANLKAKTASGDFLVMSGIKRVPEGGIKAVAGVSASLNCGSPLQISLVSRPTSGPVSMLSGSRISASAEQSIQATILGAGGEVYSTPYLVGDKGQRAPPAPTYAVLTAEGKSVESGNLEYG